MTDTPFQPTSPSPNATQEVDQPRSPFRRPEEEPQTQASPQQPVASVEQQQAATQPNTPENTDDPFGYLPKPIPERTIVSWQSPSRIFKKRNRQYFATIFVIGLLISLILIFAGQFLPIAVVLSVVFLVYVLSTVPPGVANHKITNYGIWVEDNLYYWDELGRFWFTEKFNQKILHLETIRFPGRISLLLGEMDQDNIAELLSQVLINQKPEPTFFDKAGEWIEKNIPLEN